MKRPPERIGRLLLAAALLVVWGCGSPTSAPPPPLEPPIGYTPQELTETYSGAGDQVFFEATTGDVELTFTLEGLSGQEVVFVLTNTSLADTVDNPWVMNSQAEWGTRRFALPSARELPPPQLVGHAPPEIERFNSDPFRYANTPVPPTSRWLDFDLPPPPLFYSQGDPGFLYDKDGVAIPVTARKVVQATTAFGVKTLVIWVHDACWSDTDTPLSGKVSPQMVDCVAEKFLVEGAANDIHDWASAIFGDEWGPHPYSNLIPDTSTISVLVYNIDGDGLPVPGRVTWAGFFWAKDNYKKTSSGSITDYSNERIMFYIDAVLLADDSDGDGTWESDEDLYPNDMISTLAHEYQHMVNFYQKGVVNQTGKSSQGWLDETASQIAEDLLSRHIHNDGPRGVDSQDGTAGTPYITGGWLPLFVAHPDTPVTTWQSGEQVYKSYSTAYAFGAFLARNYGGPALAREIVQNTPTDHQAVEQAVLTVTGSSLGFTELVRKWGAAVALSDRTSLSGSGLEYNRGGWFSSSLDAVSYDLGSINMYNYRYGNQKGPLMFSADGPVGYEGGQQPGSNLYFRAGGDVHSTQTWTVWMRDPVRLTVIVRD